MKFPILELSLRSLQPKQISTLLLWYNEFVIGIVKDHLHVRIYIKRYQGSTRRFKIPVRGFWRPLVSLRRWNEWLNEWMSFNTTVSNIQASCILWQSINQSRARQTRGRQHEQKWMPPGFDDTQSSRVRLSLVDTSAGGLSRPNPHGADKFWNIIGIRALYLKFLACTRDPTLHRELQSHRRLDPTPVTKAGGGGGGGRWRLLYL